MFLFKEKIEGVDYYVVKDEKGVVIAKSQDQQTAMNKAKSKARSASVTPKPESPVAMTEMAIRPREEMPKRQIEIDLSGPDGNAFSLMATAKRLYPQLHPEEMKGYKKSAELARKVNRSIPPSPVDLLIDEMMSGDYENLLQVFDREFGDYVILYR